MDSDEATASPAAPAWRRRKRTHVVQSQYPEWQCNLTFAVRALGEKRKVLRVVVLDRSQSGAYRQDDVVGEVSLDLSQLLDQRLQRRWLPLAAQTPAQTIAAGRRVQQGAALAARRRLPRDAALNVEARLVHDRAQLVQRAIARLERTLAQRGSAPASSPPSPSSSPASPSSRARSPKRQQQQPPKTRDQSIVAQQKDDASTEDVPGSPTNARAHERPGGSAHDTNVDLGIFKTPALRYITTKRKDLRDNRGNDRRTWRPFARPFAV